MPLGDAWPPLTLLGVAGTAVSNRFPLDAIITGCEKNGGGCADTTSVGPSLRLRVIDVRVDVRQGRHHQGEDQEIYE